MSSPAGKSEIKISVSLADGPFVPANVATLRDFDKILMGITTTVDEIKDGMKAVGDVGEKATDDITKGVKGAGDEMDDFKEKSKGGSKIVSRSLFAVTLGARLLQTTLISVGSTALGLYAGMVRETPTFSGFFSLLSTGFRNILHDIGETTAQALGIDSLGDSLYGASESVSDLDDSYKEMIGSALIAASVTAAVGGVAVLFGLALTKLAVIIGVVVVAFLALYYAYSNNFGGIADSINHAISYSIELFHQFAPLIKYVAITIHLLIKVLAPLLALTIELNVWFVKWTIAFFKLDKLLKYLLIGIIGVLWALDKLFNWIGLNAEGMEKLRKVGDDVTQAIDKMWVGIARLVKWLEGPTKTAISFISKLFGNLGESTDNANEKFGIITKTMKILKGIFTVYMGVARFQINLLVQNVKHLVPVFKFVIGAIQFYINLFINTWKEMLPVFMIIMGVIRFLIDWGLVKPFKMMWTFVSWVVGKYIEAFNLVKTKLEEWGIFEIIQNTIGLITEVVSGFFNFIFGKVQEVIAIFSDLWDSDKGLFGNLGNILEAVKQVFALFWKTIKIGVDAVFTKFKSFLNDLVKKFKDKFNEIVRGVGNFKNSFINKIKSVITDLVSKAKTWGKDFIEEFMNGAKDKVAGAGKKVVNKIKDLFGFTLPKEGELRQTPTWGEHFVEEFFKAATGSVKKEVTKMTDAISTDFNSTLIPNITGMNDGQSNRTGITAIGSSVASGIGTLPGVRTRGDSYSTSNNSVRNISKNMSRSDSTTVNIDKLIISPDASSKTTIPRAGTTKRQIPF